MLALVDLYLCIHRILLNLNQGTKVKAALHCEMIRVDPDTKEDVTTTCYFNSNLKTVIRKDTIDE